MFFNLLILVQLLTITKRVFQFVDIGVIVDHHCLKRVFHFVEIVVIVDHHCLKLSFHNFRKCVALLDLIITIV